MRYFYQYDVCAIVILVVLLIICKIRVRYFSKVNSLFISMIICTLIAAIFDTISCFSLSNPQDWNLTLNYFIALAYLLFYNMLSVLYFIYVYVKSGLRTNRRFVRTILSAMVAFYIVSIVSSPWTHWVAYFDENLYYCHGPLMPVLYIIPFVVFTWEFVLIIKGRENFSLYQVLLSLSLVIGMGISLGVSIVNPKMLIGLFTISVILFAVYVTLENPALYTYKDTQCMNKKALLSFLRYNPKGDMVIVKIMDMNYIEQNTEFDLMDEYKRRLATTLYSKLGKSLYNISDNLYVVILDTEKGQSFKACSLKLKEISATPIQIDGHHQKFDFATYHVNSIENYSAKELELLIHNLHEDVADENEGMAKLKQIRDEISRQSDILHAIEDAIKHDKFQVYYQPIYDTEQGKFTCAEALIRLFDEELGFINPEEMIIIAEKNGYIDKIGKIVFEKVCKFIHDNRLSNLGIDYIEVNLSTKQCMNSTLFEDFTEIMNRYGIKPEQINLEITETAELKINTNVKNNIFSFVDKGIDISLDDYGSGYATPNYIIEVPFTHVKVDKEILWGAMKDDKALVVLKHIITMLHNLDKKIIVEGVETEEMIDMLNAQGCEYYQGFYYSKPVAGDDFMRLVRKQRGL